MNIGCLITLIDVEKALLSLASISFAIIILIALKKYSLSTKSKLALIYGHLVLIFFPVVLLTTNLACGAFCMSCYNKTLSLIFYALPSTLLLSTIAGFVIIPAFYMMSNKAMEIRDRNIVKFMKKHSNVLKIKTPKVYAINRAKPVAFSFRSYKSAIFLSVGLLDIMRKKETEAIILHELAHIRQKASALKLSGCLMKFSPLSIMARFHHDSSKDEAMADEFAAKVQGTSRYLKSARRKMDRF